MLDLRPLIILGGSDWKTSKESKGDSRNANGII